MPYCPVLYEDVDEIKLRFFHLMPIKAVLFGGNPNRNYCRNVIVFEYNKIEQQKGH